MSGLQTHVRYIKTYCLLSYKQSHFTLIKLQLRTIYLFGIGTVSPCCTCARILVTCKKSVFTCKKYVQHQ